MQSSDQKNTILAIVLSSIVLFGWQYFFGPTTPAEGESPSAIEASAAPTGNGSETAPIEPMIPVDSKVVENTVKEVKKESTLSARANESFVVSSENYSFKISNNLEILGAHNPLAVSDFERIVGVAERATLQIQLIDKGLAKNLIFNNFKLSGDGHFITARNDEFAINFLGKMGEQGKLSIQLDSKVPRRYRFLLNSKSEELSGSRQTRKFTFFTKKLNTFDVGEKADDAGNTRWFGIDFNFHLLAVAFDDKKMVKHSLRGVEHGNDTFGTYAADLTTPETQFRGTLVFAKKNYDDLVSLGHGLDLSMDFGFLGVIAIPLFHGLQFFNKYLGNYGLAIIFFTIFLKFLLFPLQYKSFKSMKKMQVVQPQIQKLREKFKDDPQRMQKESMELFKKAGANPLGGCLPLLFQMPIFFAFYQVFYNAGELAGAPFYGWIVDLSSKDPYYVLPILMGIAMFFQTRLNPSTTVDPMQKKMMMFMPIIFCFFMKDLPAGVNLYIFISTAFGIIQQLAVYRMVD